MRVGDDTERIRTVHSRWFDPKVAICSDRQPKPTGDVTTTPVLPPVDAARKQIHPVVVWCVRCCRSRNSPTAYHAMQHARHITSGKALQHKATRNRGRAASAYGATGSSFSFCFFWSF